LDPKEVLAKYSERQQGDQALEKGRSLPDENRRIPAKYFFAGAICLIIIIIIPLLLFSARGPRKGLQEAAVQEQQPGQANEVLPEDLLTSPALPSAEETLPIQSSPPVGVEEGEAVQAGEAVQEEEPSPVHEHTLVITASERTWVQIQEGSSLPLDVILYPGDSVTRKSSRQLAVVIGNAGGVTVSFDGKRLTSLGEVGQVVKLTLPSPEGG
jgi:hypothetical protein